MIDIKELRKDKRPQSAWVVHALIDRLEAAEKDIAIKEEVIDSLAAVVKRLDAQCDAAEAEAIEQARLNGMGSEREAALMAKLGAAEKERDALRACIEAIKPVAWQTRTRPAWNDGTWGPWRKCSEEYAEDIKNTPLLHDWLYEARTLYTLPGAQQCKNCNGMGDRFDPSGEKIPCDLCESHLEEIRSLVAEAAHDIISGSDFWLSISLAAKKIYALPGAKGEEK